MEYTEEHAKAGVDTQLPSIECWANQFPDYDIRISNSEYTSMCPKTGLPDFGTINIRYTPDDFIIELKSLKYYLLQFRNVGMFYEHVSNRILEDLVQVLKPKWMEVTGEFTARGGLTTNVRTRYEAVS